MLPGGTANHGLVVRVGDTVVRPAPPFRTATHALLAHLRTAGFDGAPLVLESGTSTETLTYIAGEAAVLPLRPEMLDPAGYRWPRPVPARFQAGVVSHNDVHPANLIFRDGRAVALIDFDLAGPGSAAWDFASAARSWVPLQDDRDVPDIRQGRALERFRDFLEASELPRTARQDVAEAIVANHDWTYAIVTEAAAAGHQAFADHWRAVSAPAARARDWCVRHRRDLLAAAA